MEAEDIAAAALAGLFRNGQPQSTTTMSTNSEARALSKASSKTSSEQASSSNVAKKSLATKASKKARASKTKRKIDSYEFTVEPRVIQVIKKPRTFMNHSYRDFSSVPKELDYEVPTEIQEMTFSQKVHHMLSQEEYNKLISWMPHGRAFRILVPKRLEQDTIFEKYFGHSRYSTFLRQLSNHGFKHCTMGIDRNCYYHEFMLRGLPHLAKYMPEPKDAHRLISDPENEPNFYAISEKYPVPGMPEENSVNTTHSAKELNQTMADPEKGCSTSESAGTKRQILETASLNAKMPPPKRRGVALQTELSLGPTFARPAALPTTFPSLTLPTGELSELMNLMVTNKLLLAAAGLGDQQNIPGAPPQPPSSNNDPSQTLAALLTLLNQNQLR